MVLALDNDSAERSYGKAGNLEREKVKVEIVEDTSRQGSKTSTTS